ncbi:MAG: metallophosphoesterase [Clostridiales bacterium]|nr:metallophosphoesterase [Clostridiales bacterium]
MKIIHCADIHLDSPLIGVKDSGARRHELLVALMNMSEYANNNGVSAIIVAGDLFDDRFATSSTVESVAEIVRASKAAWFVLRGNHGGRDPYVKLHELCSQINFFEDSWTSYNLGNVTICGRELGHNDVEQWGRLSLDASRYNIVVLHGDIDDDSYGLIDKRALANSGARYVALGHRHTFAEHKLGVVRACYSGVLESRGFDEPTSGFVEIDTDTDKICFIKQPIRSVVTTLIDVTDITSDIALQRLVSDTVADVSPRNYLNVVLCGSVTADLHTSVVKQLLQDRFFALRIKDETTTKIDVSSLLNEVSLRGEFVKLAMNEKDEKLRDEIIKLGLLALNGGNL